MSQEESLSRKDKRALRDAERQQKGKKRRRADIAEPDALPKEDNDEDGPVVNEESEKPAKLAKKESKKRNAESPADGDEDDAVAPTAGGEEESAAQPKKKKRRKAKSEEDKPSKNRFIVFAGNLPYKTTDSSLQKHFAKLQPFTLRHRTDPQTKKSKGFAFLEFENYDRMKTCLKLYHHSMFDPEALERGEAPIDPEKKAPEDVYGGAAQRGGRKKKETARRINVELTAGGGGAKDARKEKIKEKNVRLEEQRQRRAELERKEKEKERKEGGGKKMTRKPDAAAKVEETRQNITGTTDETHGINPARLAMMNR